MRVAQREGGLDRPLLFAFVAVALAGLAVLYSAGQTDVPTVAAGAWRRQLVWYGIGIVVLTGTYRLSPRFLEWATPLVFWGAVVLLFVTLFIGTGAGTAAGTKSWLAIGGVRLGQPAELAKLAVILALARHLGNKREPPATMRDLIPACIIVGIPFLLVMSQPDLGSAIVFAGILFSMLFWAGVSPWLLLMLASPAISLLLAFSTLSWSIWIILFTLVLIWVRPFFIEGLVIWLVNVAMGVVALDLWGSLAPYQRARLISFINPEFDPLASGWHLTQSRVAIGSGGLLGKGFTEGTQKRLAFLPEQHTDFIFPVLGEEFGFVGVLVALGLFALLLLVMIRVARRATDAFSCLVVFGVVGMWFTHILENVGMTVGLMPITGIPLPFFSHGGSFLLACCIGIGLALRTAWDSRLAGYADL